MTVYQVGNEIVPTPEPSSDPNPVATGDFEKVGCAADDPAARVSDRIRQGKTGEDRGRQDGRIVTGRDGNGRQEGRKQQQRRPQRREGRNRKRFLPGRLGQAA